MPPFKSIDSIKIRLKLSYFLQKKTHTHTHTQFSSARGSASRTRAYLGWGLCHQTSRAQVLKQLPIADFWLLVIVKKIMSEEFLLHSIVHLGRITISVRLASRIKKRRVIPLSHFVVLSSSFSDKTGSKSVKAFRGLNRAR